MRASFFVFFVGGMIVFDCVYAGKSSGYTVDYSGAEYYGIGGGNALFSWLFRSNNSAPRGLVIYSNGGPWCSSLMAALYEQGPFTIDVDGNPQENPYSWIHRFHLLYIDHPIGAGLSYGPGLVGTEAQDAAMYVNVLVQLFANPRNAWLKGLPIWFAGESYCGKYAPYILREMHSAGIAVKGVLLGNPIINPSVQVGCFADYAVSLGLVDWQQSVPIRKMQDHTQHLIQQGKWDEANDAYSNVTVLALNAGGWFNPADVRVYGFPDFSAGEKWLSSAAVRSALKVPAFVPPFQMCNDTAPSQFNAREMLNVAPLYATLLDEMQIPVLIFSGNLDFTVPTMCTERWMSQLQWTGSQDWSSANRTIWRSSPTDPFAVVGYVKQTVDRRLTLVSIPNAGHMVIQNQPQVSQMLMDIFSSNNSFPVGTGFPPMATSKMNRRRLK